MTAVQRPKTNTTEAVDKVQSSSDKIKVKNISRDTLFLSLGIIEPGEKGMATRAETQTLFESLEVL
jgi:hypothetical protein